MFIGEPPRTPYDLNFTLFGFPVRVHPFFWLVAAILGANSRDVNIMFLWIGVMFVSILIHEFGHAFAFRRFGDHARVVLYAMGGLAIPENNLWGRQSSRFKTPGQQIFISAAGPLAGFVFAGMTAATILALGMTINFFPGGGLIFWQLGMSDSPTAFLVEHKTFVFQLANTILFINILWGILNLMPIYPLDGGQISREIFMQFDAQGGMQKSLMLSIAVAGCIALYGLTQGSLLMTIMFGMLAYSNWQVLQQFNGRGGGYGGGSPW